MASSVKNKFALQPIPAPASANAPAPVHEILIGIDPGVNTGIAVAEAGKFTALKSGSHSAMLVWLLQLCNEIPSDKITVILEDVHADKTNFVAAKFIKDMMNDKKLQKKIPLEAARKTYCINAACKRSRDSGMTAGYALDWKVFLDDMGITYHCLAPSERDSAATAIKPTTSPMIAAQILRQLKAPTKLTASQFTQLTGSQLTGNEHSRDAATLIWWHINKNKTFK